jgi:PAS domain S-box-containing protein
MSSDYSNAPDLDDTSDRQAALRRYHILDTAPEKNFDQITSLVAKVCDVPTALITLIDEERQWFKSCFNFDARETDIGVSFCVHAVHQGEMLVVEDATEDPRFKDNPIVTGPPHIRFYAGAPLTTPDGIHIGTLCIIDYEPRTFDAAQREILDRLADVVVNQFELRSAEAQVRQLVEHNPQPMYVYAQRDDRILRANEAAGALYGYDGDFPSLTAADLEAPAADPPSADGLSMHERKDGSLLPVRLREQEVLFDGRAAVLAVPQPVTERHDPDTTIFFRTDLDGTTQSLSAEWEDATGFPIGDTVGSSFLDFIHPLDRSSTADVVSALLNGETDACRHETSILTEEGAQAFELHARLVRDAAGTPTGAAGTLTPIIEADAPSSPATDTEAETDADDAPTAPDPEASTEEPIGADAPSPSDEPDADAFEDPEPDASAETDTPDADDAPADDEAPVPPSAAESPVPSAADESDADDEVESGPNSVFSADLPSFADAEPTSPSAPINGPSDDVEDEGPEGPSPAPTDAASGPDEEPDLAPEPFDLAARVRDVLDGKDRTARQQNVALRRSLPDGSTPVRLPPQAVQSVVGALLDDALTHTENGVVTVRIESGDDEVHLYVEDTGSTVEERVADAVAEPNAAPDGLQPIPPLVDRMGGALAVETAGDGTRRVALTLPRSSAPSGDGSASILSSDTSAE